MSAIAQMLAQKVKPLHRCVRHDTDQDREEWRRQYWKDRHAQQQKDADYKKRKHEAVRRFRAKRKDTKCQEVNRQDGA